MRAYLASADRCNAGSNVAQDAAGNYALSDLHKHECRCVARMARRRRSQLTPRSGVRDNVALCVGCPRSAPRLQGRSGDFSVRDGRSTLRAGPPAAPIRASSGRASVHGMCSKKVAGEFADLGERGIGWLAIHRFDVADEIDQPAQAASCVWARRHKRCFNRHELLLQG